MLKVTPFLLFDGNCAEAMAFYKDCLGGELKLTTVGEMPIKDNMPKGQHHKIAHAHLESNALSFSATDWLHPIRKYSQGNTVAMYLSGETYHGLKEVFDRLAVGADQELLDELKEMSFGIYGHLADKYGIHWFFVAQKS